MTLDEDLTYNYLFKKGSFGVISSSGLNYDFHNIKKTLMWSKIKRITHRAKKIPCKNIAKLKLKSSNY